MAPQRPAPTKRTTPRKAAPQRVPVEVMNGEVPHGTPSIDLPPRTPGGPKVTFPLKEKIPAWALFKLGASTDDDGQAQITALTRFVEAAIPEDQMAAFEDHLLHADPVIGIEEFNTIVEQMVNASTGRPTTPPSS